MCSGMKKIPNQGNVPAMSQPGNRLNWTRWFARKSSLRLKISWGTSSNIRLYHIVRDQAPISLNDRWPLVLWLVIFIPEIVPAHLEVHWVHPKDVSMQLAQFGQSTSNVIDVLHSFPNGIQDLGAMTTKLN